MLNYRQSISSINEAVKAGIRVRNSYKKIPSTGIYQVTLRDDKGVEYVIKYY